MAKFTNYSVSGRKKKALNKRSIVLILVGLILVLGLLVALDRTGVINLPLLPDRKSAPAPTSDGINYDPPTEEEIAETEDFKDKLGNETTTPSPTPSPSPTTNKNPVTPVMTSWDAAPNAEVSGYVSGISEEDGTCTVTLTKGDQKVTESKAATPDAKTVSCGLITINRDRLSPGTWTVTLSYSSQKSEGVSTSNTIEVN
jgi:hypothetical protein